MKLRTTLWPLGLSLLAACAAASTAGGGVVAAVVLGEQLIQTEGRQPPFAFAIAYDASRIQPPMSHAVGHALRTAASCCLSTTRATRC